MTFACLGIGASEKAISISVREMLSGIVRSRRTSKKFQEQKVERIFALLAPVKLQTVKTDIRHNDCNL